MQDVVCKLCNLNIPEFSGPLAELTYLEKLPDLGLLVLISAMGYGAPDDLINRQQWDRTLRCAG